MVVGGGDHLLPVFSRGDDDVGDDGDDGDGDDDGDDGDGDDDDKNNPPTCARWR